MAKRNKNYIIPSIIIALSLIVVAIIIAPQIGMTTYIGGTTETTLNTIPSTTSTCNLYLDKSVINSGDLITGTIQDGANTLCSVYGNMDDTGWIKIAEGLTDSTGELVSSETLSVAGSFVFRAICGDCTTNTVSLVVNPAPASPTCTDTDGINKMIAGHVTIDGISYYDECIGNSVNEYYCNGNILDTRLLPCDAGYVCFETRSGGYCQVDDSMPTLLSVTVIHGPYAGCVDLLPLMDAPDGIISVTQGAEEFFEPTDYTWSDLALIWHGGHEPAPSSSYVVNYFVY